MEIINTLESEITSKDQEIIQLKNSSKTAGTEDEDNDDLLLLIDDLESKKKMYKDQLKALGGHVSDDE